MEQLKIGLKWEDMAVYLYTAMRMYPKSERHTLAAETVKSALGVGTAIARANVTRNIPLRRKIIEEADSELMRLKILVRLGLKLEFLPMKKYEILSGQLTEIGKMLGGWLKTA